MVMHSSTKYFGGHSDMLGGVLGLNRDIDWPGGVAKAAVEMKMQRLLLGGVPGSLEGWLTLRSLRTLNMRVRTASENARNLVAWLNGHITSPDPASSASVAINAVIEKVSHASLQTDSWLETQMPNGASPPVFAIVFKKERLARHFPSKLRLFHHATSLGGVESLVEWRAMSDEHAQMELVRVSVGCEEWVDLRGDLERGLGELAGWWVEEEKKAAEEGVGKVKEMVLG